MNLTSIFRSSELVKQNKTENFFLLKINTLFRDKVGVGVGFILCVVVVYLVITLFTIYNLLVSL